MSMTDFATQHLLKDILSLVDGHVKFAETKNAALLVFAAGSIFAIAQVFTAITKDNKFAQVYIFFLVACFLLAIVFTLISFYPVTKDIATAADSRKTKHGEYAETGNLLFFGAIQNLDSEQYVKSIYAALDIKKSPLPPTRLELMFAEEIIVNAVIASRKFYWFKVAFWCILVGIVPPLFCPALICRLCKKVLRAPRKINL